MKRSRAGALVFLAVLPASGHSAPPPPRGAAGGAATASPSTAAPALTLSDGDKPVALQLEPRLTLIVHPGPEQPGRQVVLSPSWTRTDQGHWIAELSDADSAIHAALDLTVTGAAALSLEIRYARPTWVSLIALDLALPGSPAVLDRDLALRPSPPIAYLDRFAPKLVRAGHVTALVDDGVDGVIVRRAGAGPQDAQPQPWAQEEADAEAALASLGGRPRKSIGLDGELLAAATPAAAAGSTGAGDRTELRIELLSADARPFRHDARCRASWRANNPKVSHPARLREPGERDLARVELHGAGVPLLAKARWPEGRDAALSITDHADQSTPDTFAALARGRSDSSSPVGGLLGHHLVITKSLFLRGPTRGPAHPQLDDPRMSALADEMALSGSEIAPHSMTPGADARSATAAGLARFDRYHPATWIDHQPETNCEAFTNQGWRGGDDRSGARWRIADLLAQHHYRYIWSALDEQEVDLLGAGRLDQRALTMWPLGRLSPGDDGDRWLFKSTWMHRDQEGFFRALGPERLDQLERDHGLSVLHTYLETLHLDQNPRFAGRNVLLRRGPVIATSPRLEELFGDLEQRIASGRLWMPTLGALGDWLRGLDGVRVHHEPDGSAVVTSPAAIAGLSLQVAGDVDVLVDGQPPRGSRREHGSTRFWFDVQAERPARIELRARGQAAGIAASAPPGPGKLVAHARNN